VGRSPLQWVLANGKTPSATPIFRPALPKVEGLNDARTLLADFFSILLDAAKRFDLQGQADGFLAWYQELVSDSSATFSNEVRQA